jgi:hypothetical protein
LQHIFADFFAQLAHESRGLVQAIDAEQRVSRLVG